MDEKQAAYVQSLYESVARPLLYKPVRPLKSFSREDNVALQREPVEAAELYQRFFDQPIIEGERQAIVRAVRATWSFEQAEAAWQAVDDREIHLARQEINVSEHGDWAEIELFETYVNQTGDRQEVIYYFNLPESAVLTGVWLGNSPDREERFAYQIAPRGAAQAVYRNETRRNRDPALLEQIGPRQYRLRVFPVPPIRMQWDENNARSIIEDAPPLYMWLTYRTLADGDAWPLPRLAEKRNVFWDDETIRLVNGAPLEVGEETWLPPELPASQPVNPQAHRVDFPDGMSVLVTPAAQVELPGLPAGLRLAIVLDRSFSMAAHADQMTAALTRLQDLVGTPEALDVYLTASSFRGEAPARVSLADIDPAEIVYFGGQNAAELLTQFAELRGARPYDAVLVFTDGSGYELGGSDAAVPIPDAPLGMVHLGEDLSLGYDDGTLAAIQASGGWVAGDLDEALTRLAFSLSGRTKADSMMQDVLDGYVWTVLPGEQITSQTPGGEAPAEAGGFSALAARRLILAETARQRANLGQLETLDYLHALAQEYSVVTPYSSMIVLVNEEQRRLLEKLEASGDRFQREVEAIGNTTPATTAPLTGVPEPEEWLLIGIVVALLFWYAAKQRLVRIKPTLSP